MEILLHIRYFNLIYYNFSKNHIPNEPTLFRVIRQIKRPLDIYTPSTSPKQPEWVCDTKKRRISTKYSVKRKKRGFSLSFSWCHQESNRGHKDFQSFRFYDHLKQASDGNQLSYRTLCISFLSYECNFRSAVDIAVDKKSTKI